RGISVFEIIGEEEALSVLTTRAFGAVKSFKEMMDSFISEKDKLTVTELVREIWSKTGYERMLAKDQSVEAESRLENLKEFISVTEDFTQSEEEATLENFLAQVSLATDMDNFSESDDCITLMTLHTAKGLEFPVVFLVGMEEGVFPHGRAMLDNEEMEEERRLCYVGMTRAMKRLYLTRAYQRMLWGRTQHNTESRFIGEISPELLTDNLNGAQKDSNEKMEIKKPSPVKREGMLINLGDKVEHAKFGIGVVVKTKGAGEKMEVSVAFPDQGIKDFLVKYAPIKKI
ncbi:MAG: 3'-5' exonuclease, partial [Desulfitobacteriaceae bacterium]|nr:3'-5' exonuclease [Desulfitobacteriaceae bacterium]